MDRQAVGVSDEIWEVSVSDLIAIFREALLALVPQMEKARIPWREGEAYDDWDDIATSLYTSIVARSVQNSLQARPGVDLPPYDLLEESYADSAYIEVIIKATQTRFAFVALTTGRDPFDTVRAVPVATGARVEDEARAAWGDAEFSLCVPQPNGGRRCLSVLSVRL